MTSARDQVLKHDVRKSEAGEDAGQKEDADPPPSARRQWGVPGGTVVKQLHAASLNESGQSDASNASLDASKGQWYVSSSARFAFNN